MFFACTLHKLLLLKIQQVNMSKEKEINVAQAAEIAEVAKETVYYWINTGKMDGLFRKHFGRIKIKYKPFLEWVVENT